jgi:predicted nucleic acid-binding protein
LVVSAITGWLIDKSAFVRLGGAPDADLWVDRIERGLVRVAVATVLEVGYSARSGADWELLVAGPRW